MLQISFVFDCVGGIQFSFSVLPIFFLIRVRKVDGAYKLNPCKDTTLYKFGCQNEERSKYHA